MMIIAHQIQHINKDMEIRKTKWKKIELNSITKMKS